MTDTAEFAHIDTPRPTGRRPDILVICFCLAPLAIAVATVLAHLVVGDTTYFNGITSLNLLICVLTSVGVIWAGLWLRSGVLLTIIFLGNIFIIPRIAQYLFVPDWVYFPFPTFLTVDEINLGLLIYSATLVAFSVGAAAASRLLPASTSTNATPLPINPIVPFLVFVVFAAIELFVQNSAGMADYKASIDHSGSISNFTKIVVVAFSSDAALFILALAALLANFRRIGLVNFLVLILAASVFIFIYASLGSRGAGIRVIFILFACILCADWRGRSLALQVMLLSDFALIATVAIYPLAETFRKGGDAEQVGQTYLEEMFSNAERGTQATGGHLVNILNRLGNFDYIAVTAARDLEPACAAKYMNLPYVAKNIVNQFAPGDPFPEARSSTSNVFRICLGERSETLLAFYHSEIWTLYGLAKAFLGNFALLGCVLTGFLGQVGANLLRRSNHAWMRISYGYYLFIVPFSLIYSLGLDHTVNTVIIAFIRLFIALALIQAIGWAFSMVAGRRNVVRQRIEQ